VQQLVITLLSPGEGNIFSQAQVPLSYQTSSPAQCSYNLNSQANYISVAGTTATLQAKEGNNLLRLRCNETSVSRSFTVRLGGTSNTSIINDIKGNPTGSIFGALKKEDEMRLNPEQINGLFSDFFASGGLMIEKTSRVENGKSVVTLTIRNLLRLALRQMKIRVTIPKEIAQTADGIKSSENFTIIEKDPVIEFNIPELNDSETIVFEINKAVDEALLKKIDAQPEQDLSELLQKQQQTNDASKITTSFEEYEKDGEKYTKIITKIKPKRGLNDMSVIERIPKCLAKHINDVKMDEKYRDAIKVINADPLVMWHFKEITAEQEFSYEIKGVLDEDCKKQIEAMGIADELGIELESTNYLKIILPLLLIPLLGILIIYFEKFKPSKKEGEKAKEAKPKEKPSEKTAKKEEKAPEKPHAMMEEKEKDVGKFLEEEFEEAEKEFKKGMK